MLKANLMELDTNISWNCEIDCVPEVKHNFTTVYVGKQKINRPTSIERYGQIMISVNNPPNFVSSYLKKWAASKRRIEVMLETEKNIYILKRAYLKKYDGDDKPFAIFYNDFREA